LNGRNVVSNTTEEIDVFLYLHDIINLAQMRYKKEQESKKIEASSLDHRLKCIQAYAEYIVLDGMS